MVFIICRVHNNTQFCIYFLFNELTSTMRKSETGPMISLNLKISFHPINVDQWQDNYKSETGMFSFIV